MVYEWCLTAKIVAHRDQNSQRIQENAACISHWPPTRLTHRKGGSQLEGVAKPSGLIGQGLGQIACGTWVSQDYRPSHQEISVPENTSQNHSCHRRAHGGTGADICAVLGRTTDIYHSLCCTDY